MDLVARRPFDKYIGGASPNHAADANRRIAIPRKSSACGLH